MIGISVRALSLGAAQFAVLVCATGALAASDFWATATSDSFDTNGRWADVSRPTALDSATFNQPGTYEVQFDAATFTIYGGEPTINDLFLTSGNVTFYTASGATRTLSMNGTNGGHSIEVDTGTMTLGKAFAPIKMLAESLLFVDNGATLNVRFGSQLDIGLVSIIRTGSTLNVASGGKFNSPGGLDIGTDGNGTLTVDGTETSFITNGSCLWGGGGGAAVATFSNSALGTFGDDLLVGSNAGPGSSATLNVQTGADITVAGEFAIGQYGGTSTAHTLNINGPGSTVGYTGATPLVVGTSSTGTATINIGTTTTSGFLSTEAGLTINKTGTVNLGASTNTASLLSNGNITINGGVLTRGSLGSLILSTGKSVTIQNGGRATFTSNYNTTNNIYNVTGANSKLETTSFFQLGNGATINVTSGGLLTAPSYIDIGTAGNGTLTVGGTSSQVSGGNSTGFWGDSGYTASVSLSSNALATFSTGIEMARSATAGTTAMVDVLSGADLNVGLLRLAASGGATTSATLNVQGSGSTVVQTSNAFVVGHSATGSAAINIGTVTSGASFTASSLATATINKTGTVTIGGSSTTGTFTANGNLTISGGVLQRSTSSTFTLASGKTMTINSGGRATFTGSYTTAGANYTISGTNSRLETSAFMEIRNGGTVNVNSTGTLSAGSYLDVGTGGNGTLTVDGAGSTVSASGAMWWGSSGSTANLTFTSDAAGVFGAIQMARTSTAGTTSTVNVLSGSDLNVGTLSIAADGGSTTTGTLNVQGTGSTVTQLGSNTLTVGASTGTATINIGTSSSGALLSTGTGALTINRRGTVNVGGPASTGTLNIFGNASVSGAINVRSGSSVTIAAGKALSLTSSGSLLDDGRLTGDGLMTGTVQSNGVVQPGNSIGTLTIDGNYTQQSSGTLWMEIGSLSNFDRLVVTQNAALTGQILIQLALGFTPVAGDSFNLIDWNTVSGAFNVFQYPVLPDGLDWDFSQISTTGVLSVVSTVLPGDFNQNGIVDTADYVNWRKGTTYTADDYNLWRSHFGQPPAAGSGTTLGATGSASPIPEPASLMMIAVATAFVSLHWRRTPRCS